MPAQKTLTLEDLMATHHMTALAPELVLAISALVVLLSGAFFGDAIQRRLIQMIAHGISTAALFGVAGILWQRRSTLQLDQFGGIAATMPRFTVLFWTALFASIGLPGLCNFVGEYLIFQGAMAANFWYAALAATGVILGAVYMLRLFRDVMYGEIVLDENRHLHDAGKRETVAMVILLAAAVWIGVAPQTMLDAINPDTQKISEVTRNGSTPAVPEIARR